MEDRQITELLFVRSEHALRALGQLIHSFLLAQTKENRALFIRRYYLGEPVEEIAEAFRMRPNTASAKLGRMRRSLRSYLNRNWFDRSR